MTKPRSQIRCAIYTRKSSDEGLEQDFNSLDAQREACEAYIASQRHEGWWCLPAHYDDGGISGATLDRPALKCLLEDVKEKKIDVVVVYKVDRLTRALADFAKIVEIFDASKVSFVSVTQQFNTTSSMGRLTLNVLLSFAQFEREVTAERIRDKIAASKRKGMWMGGTVPLGYDAKDRTLTINAEEADTVRHLYRLFLEHKSVHVVVDTANRLGLRTKLRPQLDSKMKGGRPFTRGHMYRILSNPVYIGQISHKGQLSPGLHPPIIDGATWESVQLCLDKNRIQRRTRSEALEPSLLAGKLFTVRGNPFTPSHAVKSGKRYRYYVERPTEKGVDQSDSSDGMRIPAATIEDLVFDSIKRLLEDPLDLIAYLESELTPAGILQTIRNASLTFARSLPKESSGPKRGSLFECIAKVEVGPSEVVVHLRFAALFGTLSLKDLAAKFVDRSYVVTIAVELRRRGEELKFVIASTSAGQAVAPDPILIKAVVRAHAWVKALNEDGKMLDDIARTEGVTSAYVRRNLKLTFLAPDIVEAILDGRQAADLTLEKITRTSEFSSDWIAQRSMFGLIP